MGMCGKFTRGVMSISIVGTPQSGSAINGGNVTLTFDGTPAQNDVVIVIGGSGTFRTPNPTAPGTGYTQIALDASTIYFGAWYKRLGASPDASVVCNGTGNVNDATSYVSYVLRGVDTSTALDATATTAGETTSTNPDAPSITTVTNGAWVIACAGSRINDASITAPSGYSNQVSATNTDAFSLSVSAATKEVTTAGAENPASFTTWSSAAWFAISNAIRPATTTATGNFFLLF